MMTDKVQQTSHGDKSPNVTASGNVNIHIGDTSGASDGSGGGHKAKIITAAITATATIVAAVIYALADGGSADSGLRYSLDLQELRCLDVQQDLREEGTDQIIIEVNGRSIWGPNDVRCPTTDPHVSLEGIGPIELLVRDNTITLLEWDGRFVDPDNLGSAAIDLVEGASGPRIFNREGAEYELLWDVRPTVAE